MTAQGAVPGRDDVDQDAPVLVISQAAALAGMHPQTLRQYDRLGLVVPRRTAGRSSRASAQRRTCRYSSTARNSAAP